MSIKIQPLAEYIVVQTEEAPTKTASGLYLPNSAVEKPKTAKVVAVGKGIEDVKLGDRILYIDEYGSTNVKAKVDGEEYIVVHVKNIVAIVK